MHGKLFYNLPEFAFLVFHRNFDYSRFVNNASCSLSFFNDANNPSLVSFLFLDVLQIFENKSLHFVSMPNIVYKSVDPKCWNLNVEVIKICRCVCQFVRLVQVTLLCNMKSDEIQVKFHSTGFSGIVGIVKEWRRTTRARWPPKAA